MMGPGREVPLVVRVVTGHGVMANEDLMVKVMGLTATYEDDSEVDVAFTIDDAKMVLARLLGTYRQAVGGEQPAPQDIEQLAGILQRTPFADLIRRLA